MSKRIIHYRICRQPHWPLGAEVEIEYFPRMRDARRRWEVLVNVMFTGTLLLQKVYTNGDRETVLTANKVQPATAS